MSLLCEENNPKRAFCDAACQDAHYNLGLKAGFFNDEDTVGLQAGDGTRVEMTREQALSFKTIQNLVEDAGADDYIPLINISGQTILLLATVMRVPQKMNYEKMDSNRFLDLFFAVFYLDNSNLFTQLLPFTLGKILQSPNPLQRLRDPQFKDILMLVFVAGVNEKRDILPLAQVLQQSNANELLLLKDACETIWRSNYSSSTLFVPMLEYFIKKQQNLQCVVYLIEQKMKFLYNETLFLAIESENASIYKYVLSKPFLVTKESISSAIRYRVKTIAVLDDLLAKSKEFPEDDLWYWLNRPSNSTMDFQFNNQSIYFHISKLIILNATHIFLPQKFWSDILESAVAWENLDMIKFILELPNVFENYSREEIFIVAFIFGMTDTVKLIIAMPGQLKVKHPRFDYDKIYNFEECALLVMQNSQFELTTYFLYLICESENYTLMDALVKDANLKNDALNLFKKKGIPSPSFNFTIAQLDMIAEYFPEIMSFNESDIYKFDDLQVAVHVANYYVRRKKGVAKKLKR